jgi:hypothetical protein
MAAERIVQRRSIESHRYAFPIVREITAAAARPSQRDLVVASLLRCDRKEPSSRRRHG